MKLIRIVVPMVCVLWSVSVAHAQGTLVLDGARAAEAPNRGQVDVDFVAVGPSRGAEAYSWTTQIFSERATAMSYYGAPPSSKVPQFGASVRLGGPVGVGVRLRNRKFEEEALESVSLPHPLFLGQPTSANALSQTLHVSETSVDIGAVVHIPTSREWSAQVSGGPTWFRVRRDMVSGIRYVDAIDQALRYTAAISGDTAEPVAATGWGFNVSGDLSYFFSKNVGAGVTASVNRGRLSMSEPLSGADAKTIAGGFAIGGGLRLRF